ncbi:flagellin assembly protein [Neoasaia chiangmaiensis NBRC 101099]|uniref:Uncharacterized protein n=1 Tax=Neoasaia chiangmaiensis TaxID=320497 RepID=A0A1U9KSI9_9PROT|nr:flagellar biosynthesis regulator FlaF [Neoasaia chiangmaiensis]AQS88745.1 hypothetical protein A0U93_13375 [Neoasaia chiangmaiensis]GBR40872.1 flagellin assembly protein [Neoasaia chiangmaiensis NBRC 101099]GEN13705.1 hypothetical protein NCH01_01360 [Neoasaia chiangmaiensis]
MNYAVSRYVRQTDSGLSSKDVEIDSFKRANNLLLNAGTVDERRSALRINYMMWSILTRGVDRTDNLLPDLLKKDLISLGGWVMNFSNAALNDSSDLQPLIDINRDMIDGLNQSKEVAQQKSERHDGVFGMAV